MKDLIEIEGQFERCQAALLQTDSISLRLDQSVTKLRSQLVSLQSDFHGADEKVAAVVRGVVAATSGPLNSIARALPQTCAEMREDFDELRSAFEVLDTTWSEQTEELRATFDDTVSEWGSVLSALRDDIPQQTEAVLDELYDDIEGMLQDAVDEILDELRDRLAGILEESQSLVDDALDELRERAVETFDNIREHAEESLTEGLRSLVQRFIDRAIAESMADVAKGLVTAQVAVSSSLAASPLTPQIIALRPAVGAIKAAMEAYG